MKFKYTVFIIFIIWFHNSYATIFSHITDAEATYGGGVDYSFSIDSWEPDANPAANPCYENTSCVVGVSHRHNADGSGNYIIPSARWSAMKVPCISQAQDMNELRECLLKNGLSIPLTGTLTHVGDSLTEECVGLFSGGLLSTEATALPGSICGIAPPPTGGCTLPESVTLDHGTLSSNNISGNTISKEITIECTKEIDGRLYVEGLDNGVLDLGDSSIYSTLSINNTNVTNSGVAVDLIIGNNSLQIKSTLSVNGTPSVGTHQGQGVMILALE